MSAHMGESLDLRKLASAFRITPRHLSRLFARQCGRPPRVVLKDLRLQEGERLLLAEPCLAVEEVAWRVGMEPSHFTTYFKARYGGSPREYRKVWGSLCTSK
jgi:transcriptional regulator GlxA family with amidase domain